MGLDPSPPPLPAPSLPALFLQTIKNLPPQPASFYTPRRNSNCVARDLMTDFPRDFCRGFPTLAKLAISDKTRDFLSATKIPWEIRHQISSYTVRVSTGVGNPRKSEFRLWQNSRFPKIPTKIPKSEFRLWQNSRFPTKLVIIRWISAAIFLKCDIKSRKSNIKIS